MKPLNTPDTESVPPSQESANSTTVATTSTWALDHEQCVHLSRDDVSLIAILKSNARHLNLNHLLQQAFCNRNV